MHLRYLWPALFLLCAASRAEDYADSAKLAGSWELEGAQTSWTLAAISDGVHFTYMRGGQKVADFECNTVGKDCPVRFEGKAAKVSVYFNGPLLVLMETRGSVVTKIRFGALSEGREMQVETIPLSPGGKTETLRFKRAEAQSAAR
jgi:hypothetical protein